MFFLMFVQEHLNNTVIDLDFFSRDFVTGRECRIVFCSVLSDILSRKCLSFEKRLQIIQLNLGIFVRSIFFTELIFFLHTKLSTTEIFFYDLVLYFNKKIFTIRTKKTFCVGFRLVELLSLIYNLT